MDPYENYQPPQGDRSGGGGEQPYSAYPPPPPNGAYPPPPSGQYQAPYRPPAAQGKDKAVVSLVLGLIAVVFLLQGITAFVSIILGIVGLVFASKAKKLGFVGGERTAGFVLSLVGLIGGALVTLGLIVFFALMFSNFMGSSFYSFYF